MGEKKRRRWFKKRKKRYILLGIFALFVIVINTGLFSFRKSDKEVKAYLAERGQVATTHTYKHGKRKMHYIQVCEEKDKPLVLFMHGSPGAADAYLDYLADPRLSEKATLVSVDRPGFGRSGFGKTERSLEKQAAAVFPIIQKLQPSKVILVGHSYGGPLATRIAIDYSEAINGMVLVAPSIDPDLEPPTWWRSIINIWGIRWLVPKALRVCNQEILPLESELKKMMPGWKNIKARSIIIQGEEDKLVPPGNADFAKKMLTESEGVEVMMIKGGNHFILWSEIELVTQAILKLLKD